MGVDTTFVTMYGVKHPYKPYSEIWDWLDEMGDPDALDGKVVADSMGGTYSIWGHIFFQCDGYNDSAFEEIDLTKLEEYKQNYINNLGRLKEDFPEILDLLDGEWKLYSFTHYS